MITLLSCGIPICGNPPTAVKFSEPRLAAPKVALPAKVTLPASPGWMFPITRFADDAVAIPSYTLFKVTGNVNTVSVEELVVELVAKVESPE